MTSGRGVAVIFGLCLLNGIGQASVGPVVDVKVVGGRVQVKATAASVSEVLDRLARTTGMKVVYDGAPPGDRLTAAIDAGSETEALSRLLEGLGLTYAFKLDATGRHVETLFVTSSSTRRTSTATTGSTAAAAPSRMTPLVDDYEADDLPPEGADPMNDPTAMAAAGIPDGPGMVAGNPVNPNAGGQVGGVPGAPGAEDQNPSFPGAASFPSPEGPAPANPGFPTFPGPASYP